MISCNHFAITTTYLHGYLQIYCKKRFFHRITCTNSDSGKFSVGRAKTLSECLLAHFSYEVYTTKKVSENSETFILGAENETRTRDPNLGKVVLYQLSYFRICFTNQAFSLTEVPCVSFNECKGSTFFLIDKGFAIFFCNFFYIFL